jgi:hypothetical protein
MTDRRDSRASRRRVKREPTGEELVKLLRDSPLRDINMERVRTRSRVRDIEM